MKYPVLANFAILHFRQAITQIITLVFFGRKLNRNDILSREAIRVFNLCISKEQLFFTLVNNNALEGKLYFKYLIGTTFSQSYYNTFCSEFLICIYIFFKLLFN